MYKHKKIYFPKLISINSEVKLNKLDSFAENFIDYLNNESSGILLIDDLWGVGKSHRSKEIISSAIYREDIIKTKYYCYMNISNINRNSDLKTYIIENLKKINTENYVNIYVDNKTNFKLEISEKIRDICGVTKGFFFNSISYFSKYKKIPDPIKLSNNSYLGLRNFIYKYTPLTDEIVFVIDEIERKEDSFLLKDLFLKLIDLQENNKIKIILIMNSKELSNEDIGILNKWNEKLIYKKLTLKNNNLNLIPEIKNVHSLYTKYFNLHNLFPNPNFRNVRILKQAELFINYSSHLINENINKNKYFRYDKYFNVDSLIRIKLEYYLYCVLSFLENKKDFRNEENSEIYEAIESFYNSDNSKMIDYLEKEFSYDDKKYYNIESIMNSKFYCVNDFINDIGDFVDYFNDSLDISLTSEICLLPDLNKIKHKGAISLVFTTYEKNDLGNLVENYSACIIDKNIKKMWKYNNIICDLNINENQSALSSWLNICLLSLDIKFNLIISSLSYLNEEKLEFSIIYFLKTSKKEIQSFTSTLEHLKNDGYSNDYINHKLTEIYQNFILKINKTHISKLGLTSNILIIKYKINKSHYFIEMINELFYKNNNNLLKNISRLKLIDSNILERMESMKDKINPSIYNKIKITIENVEYNINNNIIEYIDYDELKNALLLEADIFNFINQKNSFNNRFIFEKKMNNDGNLILLNKGNNSCV